MTIWTKEKIVEMLETNDKAVTRAVIAIYQRQTLDEQVSQHTLKSNNIGFNSSDAPYLSYCAKYAIDKRTTLSGKHLEKSRTRIRKYWKQLMDIANSNVVAAYSN
jgi:hypothetical protein